MVKSVQYFKVYNISGKNKKKLYSSPSKQDNYKLDTGTAINGSKFNPKRILKLFDVTVKLIVSDWPGCHTDHQQRYWPHHRQQLSCSLRREYLLENRACCSLRSQRPRPKSAFRLFESARVCPGKGAKWSSEKSAEGGDLIDCLTLNFHFAVNLI